MGNVIKELPFVAEITTKTSAVFTILRKAAVVVIVILILWLVLKLLKKFIRNRRFKKSKTSSVLDGPTSSEHFNSVNNPNSMGFFD